MPAGRPAETQPVKAPGPPSDSPLQQTLGRRALDAYESALGRLSDAEREAVRSASLRLLEMGRARGNDWAGFVAAGDWR